MTPPGLLLRQARTGAGLSIRVLADAAGVSPSTVSRIEAGLMDPTVGMLRRLLAAAGVEVDLVTREIASPELASLADAWHASPRGDVIDWTRLRAFTDFLFLHPEQNSRALRRRPESSGSQLLDNILAGIAETQALKTGLDAPSWTKHVPALRESWVAAGTPVMQDRSRAESPPALAARGVAIPAASLWRNWTHAS